MDRLTKYLQTSHTAVTMLDSAHVFVDLIEASLVNSTLHRHCMKWVHKLRTLEQGVTHHNYEYENSAESAEFCPEFLLSIIGQVHVAPIHIE